MLLRWENTGFCANPPGDWAAVVFAGSDGWFYEATRCTDEGAWLHVHAKHRNDGYPTARAAQLAAEAALLRLGVIPLPAWDDLPGGALLVVHEYLASCRVSGSDIRGWSFDSLDVHESVLYSSLADAKAAAERHLRAEYAAWLDEEAAKEGVR